MKKIILMGSGLIILAGCTTPVMTPVKVDKEPILVGMPIGERVGKSEQSISEQINLLDKIKAKKYVGTFEVVKHNNDMDARKGSSQTIPQAYAYLQEKPTEQVVASINPVINPMQNKIKKIEWENNSANELGQQFANALGYKFSTTGNKDEIISLRIENETMESAVNKFKNVLKDKAVVLLVEQNKTFTIIYNK
jgi:hypothetical protein